MAASPTVSCTHVRRRCDPHQQGSRAGSARAALLRTAALGLAVIAAALGGSAGALPGLAVTPPLAVNSKKLRQPRPTFEELKEYTLPEEVVATTPNLQERDRYILEVALQQCGYSGDSENALRIIKLLEERGFKRTKFCWRQVMVACRKAQQWDKVVDVLDMMVADGIQPDHVMYHDALESCEGKGVPETALRLFRAMQGDGRAPNMVTYIKVMNILLDSGDEKTALELYHQARGMGFMDPWSDRGRALDLQDLPIPVAVMVARHETADRARLATSPKAGKGGFYVLTGYAPKSTAHKQKAILKVLGKEFGLKVRVDPARFGRCTVKADEMKRVGLLRAQKQQETKQEAEQLFSSTPAS